MDLKEVVAKTIMLTVLMNALIALLRYYSVRYMPPFNTSTIAITFIVSFILVAIFTKTKED